MTVGDIVEAEAISAVFESFGCYPFGSSTKGSTGHLLGAAGALEAAITALALHYQKMPVTKNLCNIDVGIPKSLKIIAQEDTIPDISLEFGLSNSFGFGGVNTSLLFRRFPN